MISVYSRDTLCHYINQLNEQHMQKTVGTPLHVYFFKAKLWMLCGFELDFQ